MLMNIIGSGNVGQTFAKLLSKKKLVNILGVYNRTKSRAEEAVDFIQQGFCVENIESLPHADITMIATADDYIETAAKLLSENKYLKNGDTVLHFSGVLSSDILTCLKDKGCYVASIHPMRSIIKPIDNIGECLGVYCAVEGDKEALAILRPMFDAIGLITYLLNKDKKSLYHAAGVFASNYLITLAQESMDCLQEAEVDESIIFPMVMSLMQGTLTNLARTLSPKSALTGPIKRGDEATIAKHLLGFSDDNQKKLYTILAAATQKLV
jgi:predicted short-subunit dehydrogenase-like oxidoreductase (DUF2520 family)